MEGVLTESLFWDPNVLYFVLVVGAWSAMVALLIPGTGVVEAVVVVALVYSVGGLVGAGAAVPPLLVLGVSFGIYAAIIVRKYARVLRKQEDDLGGELPLLIGLLGAVTQAVGGFWLLSVVEGLAWWLVVVLALGSLAVYRWMLLPTVAALMPPPKAGVEALIGERGEIRTPPQSAYKPGTVYLAGELWQAISEDTLHAGDIVEVVERQGMRLVVQKLASPDQGVPG